MNVKSFIEKFFFKKRHIIHVHNNPQYSDYVFSTSMADFDIEPLLEEVDQRFANYLIMRKNNPAWVIFYYKKDNEIYGYSFLHVPQQEEWNDCLPTMPQETRVGSAFVYPQHRGKRIISEIYKVQRRYAIENNLKFWGIIENSNNSSIRSLSENAYIARKNYLIKFFKLNILSVLTNPFKIYVLFGKRRANR